MKKQAFLFVLLATFCASYTDAAACIDGWTAYKDELCIKEFPNVANYEEAKSICSSESIDDSKSSLLLVKDAEFQSFVENFTEGIFDFVWLGGKFDNETKQFLWEDGETLEYTNWLEDHPRNDSTTETCIELRPTNERNSAKSVGKWVDVNCQKRNLVICQRPSSWTLPDAIEELKRIRKQHEEDVITVQTQHQEDVNILKGIIEENQKNILTLQQQLATISSNLESLKQNAITDLRLTGKQQVGSYYGPGYADTSGYVITGVINGLSDNHIDYIDRRLVQKLVNGNWVTVAFN